MLLRVRICKLLSTAWLEAPPDVNTSDQEKWESQLRYQENFWGAMADLPPPRRNATGNGLNKTTWNIQNRILQRNILLL